MPELTEAEFNERRDRAFDPHSIRKLTDDADLSRGGDGDAVNEHILSQMDSLINGDDDAVTYQPRHLMSDEDYDLARKENPATKIVHKYTSRYDRAFSECRALENKLATLTIGTPEYHECMAQLAKATSRVKIELNNSTDDNCRENERTDEWRATIGHDEYNASRRDRETANQMTPKEVLAAETPEAKKERVRKRDSELKAKKRAIIKAARAKDQTI